MVLYRNLVLWRLGTAVFSRGAACIFLENLGEVALIVETAVQTNLNDAFFRANKQFAGFLYPHTVKQFGE